MIESMLAPFGKALNGGIELIRVKYREPAIGCRGIMLELRRLVHAGLDLAILVVRDDPTLEALCRNNLTEALHHTIEKDILDAAFLGESLLPVL